MPIYFLLAIYEYTDEIFFYITKQKQNVGVYNFKESHIGSGLTCDFETGQEFAINITIIFKWYILLELLQVWSFSSKCHVMHRQFSNLHMKLNGNISMRMHPH